MKTNDVLLFIGGVALGFFASRMNWGSRTVNALEEVVTGVKEDVKDVAVDTVKKSECEKKLSEALMTVKLSAGAMDSYKKNFLANCMASK